VKSEARIIALKLRQEGKSINEISSLLGVAKSSVSVWVRDIKLDVLQLRALSQKGHDRVAIEKRRQTRLTNEARKRQITIDTALSEITEVTYHELWLIGIMLYWAEGGKTQRLVRFSNGDPEMIKIMMAFFRIVCMVPEKKFRGYIHIHPHLDHVKSEKYWSEISDIPTNQFFKTYRKLNKSSQGKKDSLPNGVFDIYVLDTKLFLKIEGWAKGVFLSY